MPAIDLIKYISQMLAARVDSGKIMRDLLKAGWSHDEILAAYIDAVAESKTNSNDPIAPAPPTETAPHSSPISESPVVDASALTVSTSNEQTQPTQPNELGPLPLSQESVQATSETPSVNLSKPAPSLLIPVPPIERPLGVDFKKRKKLFIIVAAAAAVLIIGGITWALLSKSSSGMSMSSGGNVAAGETETTAHVPMDDIPVSQLNNINPTTYLTTWNFSNLAPAERAKYYQEKRLPDGTMQREYWITAAVKTITIAKGFKFQAWAYDGQVPGPTLRATEGDSIIVHFKNDTNMDHTIHFHGFHDGSQDGALPSQYIHPGGSTTYTFKAAPAGLQLYHCHVEPLAEHINQGMYGTFIIDPKVDPRPKPVQEFVIMMNAFDTTDPMGDAALKNGDGTNTVYAANTVAFWYMNHKINVKVGQLYRIYLVNMTEFDDINSFHLHGNFFTVTPTGTIGSAQTYTDTTDLGQGERDVIDVKFQAPGDWMFHSHKTEFTNKGWMGYFHATL